MASNAPSEETKNTFRRSFLEAMRNMTTVAAYTFAATYIQHRHHNGLFAQFMGIVASGALGALAYFGGVFTVDLLWAALHARFPQIRKRSFLLFAIIIIVSIAAIAPMYLVWFRDN